ncbi:hypothetical protein [Corynebacterium variabile]|uniref:hypothetical protein n=1 Tax=Corynebacterium variabile TaxID=1727 RepID=UPI00020014D8
MMASTGISRSIALRVARRWTWSAGVGGMSGASGWSEDAGRAEMMAMVMHPHRRRRRPGRG